MSHDLVIQGPRYPEDEIILVDAYNETWTRKKTIPYGNDSLPARRFGHAMGSGSILNTSIDSENQDRSEIIDKIVMFGGVGLDE